MTVDRRQAATAAELAAMHQSGPDGMCRCGRPLPCPVATAARRVLDRPRPRAIGRAPVQRLWAPRRHLMTHISRA